MKSLSASVIIFCLLSSSVVAQQDIRILADAVELTSGAGSFDIGDAYVGYPASYFFLIENVGDNDLTLDGTTPISIGGSDPGSFVTSVDIAGEVIAAGGLLAFDINVNAATAGSKSIVVTINSDDPDEAAYTFTVTANVLSAPPDCEVLSGDIENIYTGSIFQGFLGITGAAEYQAPAGWSAGFNSLLGALFGGEINVGISADAHGGSNALEIFSDGTSAGDALMSFKCAESSSTLKGYYKFSGAASDEAMIIVSTGGSDNTTDANSDTLHITSDAAAYTLFEIDVPRDANSVDSVLVYLAITNNSPGTSLKVDDLELMAGGGGPLNFVSMIPQPNSHGAFLGTGIGFEFSEEIDIATVDGGTLAINDDNILIRGEYSGFFTGTFNSGGMIADNWWLNFNPDNDFLPGELITVTINTGVKSTDGINLTSPFSAQFTIAPHPGPQATPGFLKKTVGTAGSSIHPIYAADLDRDGDMDVLTATSASVIWYENNGSEEFTSHTISSGQAFIRSLHVDDIDMDGDLDVFSVSSNDDKIVWLENDGNQVFTPHTISSTADDVQSAYGTDIDLDGDIDLVTASSSDHTVAWYENDGTGTFSFHAITTGATFVNSVFATDIDGDGDVDVVSAGFQIEWYENDGSQNFSVHSVVSDVTRSIYATDFDGDSDIDLVSGFPNADKVAWFENDGSESFSQHTITTTADGINSVYAADLDGDGDMDVLSASVTDSKIAWYTNNGSGTFTAHTITTSATTAQSVCAADVDGDNDLDVLSASSFDQKVAWYENTDVTPPVASATDLTVELDETGHAIVDAADANVSSIDNVTAPEDLTFSLSQFSFNCSSVGDNLVTFRVFDEAGNLGTQFITITVEDNQVPVVVAKDITVTLDNFGTVSIYADDIDNGSFDNCFLFLEIDKSSFDEDDLGENIVTLTGSDESGNEATATAVVTVKKNQTITFDAIPSKTFGDPDFDISVNSTSGLPVSLAVSGPITLTGTTVSITGGGSATITATQEGNNIYNAAQQVVYNLLINKASQSVTFTQGDVAYESGLVLTLNGESSVGLPVTYTFIGNNQSTISGNELSVGGPGSHTVTAHQSGNENYAAASDVEVTFCVNPLAPTISMQFANTENALLNTSNEGPWQWYFDGEPIPGETDISLAVMDPGMYQLSVTIGGCDSPLSEPFSVIVTSVEESTSVVKIYPNPVSDVLTISGLRAVKGINMTNASGQSIDMNFTTKESGTSFNTSNLSSGIYIMNVLTEKDLFRFKVVKR